MDVQPNPPFTPDACNLTTPNGVIPDKDDCSKFFTCDNGLSVPGTCYFGLFFNNETKKCDLPRNVNTENCTVPVTTPTPTQPTNSTIITRKTPHPPTTQQITSNTRRTTPTNRRTTPTTRRTTSTTRRTTSTTRQTKPTARQTPPVFH